MHLMYVEENGQRKYTLKKVLGKAASQWLEEQY